MRSETVLFVGKEVFEFFLIILFNNVNAMELNKMHAVCESGWQRSWDWGERY